MDLRTRYLGLELASPFVCGASPLTDSVDGARRLEDAGVAALVLPSLFEEQIEHRGALELAGTPAGDLGRDPDRYLDHVRRVREAVDVPVIASLNGTALGGWLAYARRIEEAGADGLELNVHRVIAEPTTRGAEVEDAMVEIVTAVSDAVLMPVAVKLAPTYTALAQLALRLEDAGADGLVLFNRFHEIDVDLERLELRHQMHLSGPAELGVRLRWLAILRGSARGSLAATGGVHTIDDALKVLACGADVVQLVSELLAHGPGRLTELRGELERWLACHEIDAVADLIGCVALGRGEQSEPSQRALYVRALSAWPQSGG